MRRPFTPEEDARLEELRMIYDGVTGRGGIRKIGRIMGRHHRSVKERLVLLAMAAEGDKHLQKQRMWTPDEVAFMRIMRAAGDGDSKIAKALGRTEASVRRKRCYMEGKR